MIELTAEQALAVAQSSGEPPTVVDPRTLATYVLLPKEEYDRLRDSRAPTAVSLDDALKQQFTNLVREWKNGRRPASALKMAAHPAYRRIVGMGKAAVPLLLAELRREPDHWFIALHELTGADPVPEASRGRLREMADAWIRWGREHGLSE